MRVNYRRNLGGLEAVMTYAATTSGATFDLSHMTGYSVTAVATETVATLAGTLKLQVSNNARTDNTGIQEASDAVWVDLPGSSQAVSGTGTFVWSVADAMYAAVRVVWTKTTGTGTFDVIMYAKGNQG